MRCAPAILDHLSHAKSKPSLGSIVSEPAKGLGMPWPMVLWPSNPPPPEAWPKRSFCRLGWKPCRAWPNPHAKQQSRSHSTPRRTCEASRKHREPHKGPASVAIHGLQIGLGSKAPLCEHAEKNNYVKTPQTSQCFPVCLVGKSSGKKTAGRLSESSLPRGSPSAPTSIRRLSL